MIPESWHGSADGEPVNGFEGKTFCIEMVLS